MGNYLPHLSANYWIVTDATKTKAAPLRERPLLTY